MNGVDALFQPFQLGNLKLRNRIVMPAMTRHRSPGNVPGDDVRDYYARRAKSVGLIVTEGTCINHPAANAYEKIPFFHGTDALAGWKRACWRCTGPVDIARNRPSWETNWKSWCRGNGWARAPPVVGHNNSFGGSLTQLPGPFRLTRELCNAK